MIPHPGQGVRLVESCGGAALHWVGEARGESLQGWYKSKTQARKAYAAMPPLKDGTKLPLVMPCNHPVVLDCMPAVCASCGAELP